jgi:gamma-glutamyltranspeptidase/glutathione hydrolase
MTKTQRFLTILSLAFLAAACGQAQSDSAASEGDASQMTVAVANPLAAEAGMEVLRAGGSAIDAAIAVQAVLGLVEPQSSGPGGGAFLLYFDVETGAVEAYDGREMAPRATRPDHFLGPDGTPRGFADVVAGGQSVGVPGVMAMLEMVHGRHGTLPWADLFGQAGTLADEGFAISPRLRYFMDLTPWTRAMPDPQAYFSDEEGNLLNVGDVLRNPAYGQTMRLLAREGAGVLYEGALAEAIIDAVQNAPVNQGTMTLDDLAAYEALEREVICRPYRAYRICGMPPPTSGGVAILQILSLLEPFDLAATGPGSAEAVHLIAEASRLAYADRDMYLADADFVAVPTAGLLSADYLQSRAALIDPAQAMEAAEAGNPWPDNIPHRAPDLTPDVPGTSHVAIIDAAGNALTMTTTVESIFGSNVMVGGFFLNNQLTDFSFEPQRDGYPVANAPAPGKRPRSSMAPMVIFDQEGALFAIIGSGGGSRIPLYVVQSIIAIIDWDMTMQDALNLPHHTNRNGATELEAGTELEALTPTLEAMGHEVRSATMNSGTQGIRIVDGVMDGGADPRREGVVLAE